MVTGTKMMREEMEKNREVQKRLRKQNAMTQ